MFKKAFLQLDSSNFLRISVFYERMRLITTRPLGAYDFGAFLSDIGGSLGLFVGASVLTLFELAYLTFSCGRRRCRRRHRVMQKRVV